MSRGSLIFKQTDVTRANVIDGSAGPANSPKPTYAARLAPTQANDNWPLSRMTREPTEAAGHASTSRPLNGLFRWYGIRHHRSAGLCKRR